MRLIPIHDKILIRKEMEVETIKGGIIIPAFVRSSGAFVPADVVAVSNGIPQSNGIKRPLGVVAGDRVMVHRYGGSEIRIDHETFHMIAEKEVICVIDR